MAVRLARPASEVLGALKALRRLDKIDIDPSRDDIDPSQLITITASRA